MGSLLRTFCCFHPIVVVFSGSDCVLYVDLVSKFVSQLLTVHYSCIKENVMLLNKTLPHTTVSSVPWVCLQDLNSQK